MSQANPAAVPDAAANRRGVLAPGPQELPAGPKTFQDLLKLAGDWSHTIDPGGGPFELDGEPLELGDLSTGTYADLASKPGLRRYTGHPSYDISQLQADLSRFTFILGGDTDGELFLPPPTP